MKAWVMQADGKIEELDCAPHRALAFAHTHITPDALDITRVFWNKRMCSMIVDDGGHEKGLPVNVVATEAYRKACRPGTTHEIRGPVVIFDGLLP